VRKVSAHSISKIFTTAGDLRNDLLEILSLLLGDRSTMVLSGAMAAFAEVCPTRFDLLHAHFRKICVRLADMDEWGQVVTLNSLLRYGRSQFLAPQARPGTVSRASGAKKQAWAKPKGKFYSSGESSSDSEDEETKEAKRKAAEYELDPDHYTLLRNSLQLLKSRNAGVVVAVASIHFYCGRPEFNSSANRAIGRALVRVMRNHREMAYIVLKTIITIAEDRPVVFEPFLKRFFITVRCCCCVCV